MMNLKINVTAGDDCSVIVEDLLDDYLPEAYTGFSASQLRWSDSASVAVLISRKSSGDEVQTPIFFEHDDSQLINIPVKFDGWFVINYIVLPTKDWVYRWDAYWSVPEFKDGLYFVDGQSLKKIVNGVEESAELSEIISNGYGTNTEGTTIHRLCNSYFSVCFLSQCYTDLAKRIFEARGFSRCDTSDKIDSELIYRKDLAWMTLNVIQYMVSGELHGYYGCETITSDDAALEEAQRIIERVSGCNGICRGTSKAKSKGCGCL